MKVFKREEVGGEDVEFKSSKRVVRSAFISFKISYVFPFQIESVQISKIDDNRLKKEILVKYVEKNYSCWSIKIVIFERKI